MQIDFLEITQNQAYLLGYKLKLSKTEHRILYAIAENGPSDVDFLLSLLSDGVSRGNVAVHINSINKKAECISDRRIVIFENSAYKINPLM